jgi:hypothetical protein
MDELPRFSPFERRFPYLLLWKTALAGRFCVARGTRDTKIQVIEVSVSSPVYLFSVRKDYTDFMITLPVIYTAYMF